MLTKKQYNLLMLIHNRQQKDGVSPSFDEMREALGLRSKSGIHRFITALEERGFIRRLPYRARAIKIIRLPENVPHKHEERRRPAVVQHADPTSGLKVVETVEEANVARNADVRTVPLIGRIAAGAPIEALQQGATRIGVPSMMISSSGKHYALEVKGDSMIDVGIHEGDIAVIHRQSTANNGDIVVALIDDDEVTLKRLRRKGGAIALEAANMDHETRLYRSDQVKIQGRMVGLIRTY